jgi:phage-related protein
MAFLRGFNGTDCAPLGLVTPGHRNLLGPADRIYRVDRMPGSDVPQITTTGLKEKTIQLRAVMAAASHAQLIDNLDLLWGVLLPDDASHLLETTDYTTRGIMGYMASAPIESAQLPGWVRVVDFPLTFLCFPYWQDLEEQAETISDPTGTLTNAGHMRAFPTYTITLTDDLPAGFGFTVGGLTWTYEGAGEDGDVFVVDADPTVQTLTVNGTENMADVALASRYPYLEVGSNAVSITDSGKMTLAAAFAQRYR